MIARTCTAPQTLAAIQENRLRSYLDRCVPGDRPSIAASLITFWDRPWSTNAKRFAAHALNRAYMRGIDVLEESIARSSV